MQSVYLIGLGAIGSVYARLLHDAHPDHFRVIMQPARRARFEQNPLIVDGKVCNFDFAEEGRIADTILVCVKVRDLDVAIRDMRPFVGESTVILPLLNGVTAHEALTAAFPRQEVLYGVSYMSSLRDAHEVHCKNLGKVVFGKAHNEPISEPVARLQNLFSEAGIPNDVAVDMLHATWVKFMANVAANQASAVLRMTYGELKASPHAKRLLRDTAMEVIPVAEACGVRLKDSDLDNMFHVLAHLPIDGKTSMLQDVEAGRKTEVETFSGTVLSLGRRHGKPTPTNQVFFDLVTALEEKPIVPSPLEESMDHALTLNKASGS